MPRFVLLYHDCPPGYVKSSHWDFMLEADGALWTWELRALPSTWCSTPGMTSQGDNRTVAAQRLADHRMEYLNYEGPLTAGRGSVKRVASGEFKILDNAPDKLVLRLAGDVIQGEVELTQTSQLTHWQLTVRGP